MRRLMVAPLIALLAACATAPEAQPFRFAAVDGDTIRAGRETIRVVGVDTPELHGRCAAEIEAARRARDFTAAALQSGEVRVEPVRRRDRYGRTLAVVTVDGRDLAAMLVEAGLGRPYKGERRSGWC